MRATRRDTECMKGNRKRREPRELTCLLYTSKTKTTVTPDFVRAMKPDAVIVATGGVYGAPDVPGIDLGIVSTVPQLTRRCV